MSAGTPPLDVLIGVVPLVRFTGERRKMGEFASGRLLSVVARSVAVVIGGLNGWLLFQTALEWL